jgi:uncharacterized LabA/DUF88 family protein
MIDLVMVDGPNLFGTVGTFLERNIAPEHRNDLRLYMADWFDFDRLVLRTLGEPNAPTLGIVLVHSNKHLGKDSFKLSDPSKFWGRQSSNPGTSSLVVALAKDDQEHYQFECSKCGESNQCKSVHEKGVDSTMIVYMFETAERWDSLCIFSRDTDFVPAVWSLRRRGKQVYVAAEKADATTALGRASQSFFQVNSAFILRDFGSYLAFRSGGIVDDWIAGLSDNLAAGLNIGVWTDGSFSISSGNPNSIGALGILAARINQLPGLGDSAAISKVIQTGVVASHEADRVADQIICRWVTLINDAKTRFERNDAGSDA